MTKIGRILKACWMIRVYRDGDGFGFVWRWWNPLTWVVAPLALGQSFPSTFRRKHYDGFPLENETPLYAHPATPPTDPVSVREALLDLLGYLEINRGSVPVYAIQQARAALSTEEPSNG